MEAVVKVFVSVFFKLCGDLMLTVLPGMPRVHSLFINEVGLDFFVPEKDGLTKDHQHRTFSSISSFISKNTFF
jgi:hypothetical protein